MMIMIMITRSALIVLITVGSGVAFSTKNYKVSGWSLNSSPLQQQEISSSAVSSIKEASKILQAWDTYFNPEVTRGEEVNVGESRTLLPDAVRLLNDAATLERSGDSTTGRCMLGICASSLEEGVSTLKAWVTTLQLPRGLLHGMDVDGVPLEINGGVYIKYNSGGVYTFEDIRKSGAGFEALWKPGDAMLEPYEGTYRGVYFQVELADGEFRQYLVPLDTFPLDV
jgi:Domain of unknown function (DUF1824)